MLAGLRTLIAVALPIASIAMAQPIRPLPVLPPELQDRADQIVVKVGFYVGRDGKPSVIRLVSGDQFAYQAAANAVSQWEYPNPDVPRLVEVQFSWHEGKARIQTFNEQRLVPHHSVPRYHLKPENAPPAVYPDQAKLAGIAGYILVQMNLNSNGSVKDAHVKSARIVRPFSDPATREDGVAWLTESALAAARQWKFEKTDPLPPSLDVWFRFADEQGGWQFQIP